MDFEKQRFISIPESTPHYDFKEAFYRSETPLNYIQMMNPVSVRQQEENIETSTSHLPYSDEYVKQEILGEISFLKDSKKLIRNHIVDSVVDSYIFSTLLPLSKKHKKSEFFSSYIIEPNSELLRNSNIKKMAQKRLFLLSIGKKREINFNSAGNKRKNEFFFQYKKPPKSILKNTNETKSNRCSPSFNKNDGSANNENNNMRKSNAAGSNSNQTILKRVHFVPQIGDKVPKNAVVFDFEIVDLKRVQEEEKEIRRQEEELMRKIKSKFLSQKNKYFTTSSSSSVSNINNNVNMNNIVRTKKKSSLFPSTSAPALCQTGTSMQIATKATTPLNGTTLHQLNGIQMKKGPKKKGKLKKKKSVK